MSKLKQRSRQNIYYHMTRSLIFFAIGGRICRQCGTTENVELDCVKPCPNTHDNLSSCSRTGFYWRQFQKNNLQPLCRTCNAKKSDNNLVFVCAWCFPVKADFFALYPQLDPATTKLTHGICKYHKEKMEAEILELRFTTV
jgi:hypothetical protein